MVNPNSWGLGKRPAHQYVVKEATTRRQVLHRIKHGHLQSPMRPAIWADSTDDQRSGLRAIRHIDPAYRQEQALHSSASESGGVESQIHPPSGMIELATEAATALARSFPFTGFSTSPSHAAAAILARHSRC
ncbi:g11736 [Coccomyxa elongata]